MINSFAEACTILQVGVSADIDSIKSAYRKLCRIYHPDVKGESGQFEKINEAYNYAIDYCKRNSVNPSRIIGTPVKAHSNKKSPSPLATLKKQEELKKRAEELKQKQEEEKILEQIRWIRLAGKVNEALREDQHRKELEQKIKEAIRKAAIENQ